jgi:hypothetical protein
MREHVFDARWKVFFIGAESDTLSVVLLELV